MRTFISILSSFAYIILLILMGFVLIPYDVFNWAKKSILSQPWFLLSGKYRSYRYE